MKKTILFSVPVEATIFFSCKDKIKGFEDSCAANYDLAISNEVRGRIPSIITAASVEFSINVTWVE